MVRKSRRLNSNMATQEELAEMERLSASFAPETKASSFPDNPDAERVYLVPVASI